MMHGNIDATAERTTPQPWMLTGKQSGIIKSLDVDYSMRIRVHGGIFMMKTIIQVSSLLWE